ncbi:zinc finger lsd1 subclass family protein (macronuclear) [Tetrahymena thermophila SB210]|uniref:Zinc finger lsd1 subclass family protein n=1 Tax=Tetrahymena thermophila (strain SB210) TaxID=312017 RepID=W7X8I6_TETTS|nr:zinc finger lsd1 subclass family protein [Tetrahymena thermophila SB210]EWS75690.1 zinc finger lsd1 subclass family protein [Tetrahymena thermophila SB210]|eukprot:XP_012651763.1 zinc finger lsd1 subclass family protein [Tetrahymena thermophila SB210]
MKCDSCNSISYLVDGECVKIISNYQPLNSGKSSEILFKSLTLDNFAEITVSNYLFQLNNFLDDFYDNKKLTQSTVTLCGGYQILGGAYLASTGASIEKSFANLKPHWKIDISFVAFKIDQWQTPSKIYNILVLVDQNGTTIDEQVLEQSPNICGRNNYSDQIVQITVQNLQHNLQNLNIKITTDLNDNSSVHSFGIREFYVQIHYCPDPNCLACSDINSCTSCQIPTFLYQGTCVSKCQDGFYGDNISNQCLQCNKICKTCIEKADKCLSCQDSLYYQQSINTCVKACDPNQYADKNNQCQPCNINCNTCNGGEFNNCQSCYPKKYLQSSINTCDGQCYSNQYADDQTSLCTQCDTSCKTCQGKSSTCTSCNDGRYLKLPENQCVVKCDLGFYEDKSTNTCQKCHSSCQGCNGGSNNNCTSCQSPNFLQQLTGKCVNDCGSNYYGEKSTSICTICHKSCKDCLGGTSNDCLSCNDGTFLQLPQKQCVVNCDLGYYGDPQINSCQKCNPNCKGCNGSQKNNCTSCQPPQFLQQSTGECVSVCQSNQYGDISSSICAPCNKQCKTCFGGSNSDCLSCNNGTFYQQSLNQCLSICNSNQYQDTINNTCSSCHQNCLTCFGPNLNQCLSCQLPLYFDKNTNQCTNTCKNGFYPGLFNNLPICLTCESAFGEGCILCDQKQCNKCSQTFFSSGIYCVDKCPQNTITSFKDMTCSQSCEQSFVVQDNVCQSSCKEGYYASSPQLISNNLIRKCEKCDSQYEYLLESFFAQPTITSSELLNWTKVLIKKCDYCNEYPTLTYTCQQTDFSEFNQNQIFGILDDENTYTYQFQNGIIPHYQISIKVDILLLRTVDPEDGFQIALSDQNNNQLFTSIWYTKNHYTDGYLICSEKPDTLIRFSTILSLSSYNFNLIFHSKLDQDYPDEGFGIKNLNIYLNTCHPSCFRCDGPNYNNCLSCSDSSKYDAQQKTCQQCSSGQFYHQGLCISSCPAQFQGDQNYICVKIQNNCDSYDLSMMKCNRCKPISFYMIDGECVSQISQLYKPLVSAANSEILFKSLTLDSFGEITVSNYQFQITFFDDFYYEKRYTNSTVTLCNIYQLLGGAYLASINSQIQKSFTNLQPHWKIDITFVAFIIDQWQILDTIYAFNVTIDDQLIQFQKNILQPPTQICGLQSQNDQIVQIIALDQPHHQQSLDIKISTNLDQNSSVHSFGIREFYVQIHYCTITNCLSCISLTECISCGNNTFLYQGQCVSQCDDSFYGDTIQNKCIACDKSCKTCYGGTSSNCLSCNDGLFFQQTLNQCLNKCNVDQYGDLQTNICKPCHQNCKTCDGGTSSNCLSCNDGLFFQQTLNQCLNKCNVDQYGDLQTNICKPCHQNCKTCFGGQQNNCQSCYQSTFLQQSTGECVSVCNSNQYGDTSSGICTLCHKLCKTCSGGSNDNCLSCNNGTFYQQSLNQCLTQCNSNQYKDTINNTCCSCNQTCLTCFGPDPNQCSSCQLPLYFDKITNSCKSQCSNGFYPQSINNHPVCLTCQSTYGEGCIICDQNSCIKCKQSYFTYGAQCVDICPQNTITSFINKTCSLECDQPFVLQDSICQSTCKDGYYAFSSKSIQNNMITKCEQCDSKCQKCQNNVNDCTVCSDIQSIDCMSLERQGQYLKQKICDTLGLSDSQTDCENQILSSQDMDSQQNYLIFQREIQDSNSNEYLLQSLFTQNPIPAADLRNWSRVLINNHNNQEYPYSTFTCVQSAFSEFSSSQIYGLFDLEHQYSYYFSNSIPHYQISIKLDLLLLMTVDTNDFIQISVYDNNLSQYTYLKYYTKYNNFNDGFNICSPQYLDTMVRFSAIISPSKNFRLMFYSHLDEFYQNEAFGIKNLYVYLNTCHPSCLTCDGPNYNNCLSCSDNKKYSPNLKTCSLCDNGQLYHYGNCVDSCPGLFLADYINQICQIANKYCENYNSSTLKCESCNPLQSYEIDGECVKLIQNYNTKILFKSLTLDTFGEMQVNNYQFKLNNFFGDFFYQQYAGSTVTQCGNYQILGGAYLASKGASIQKVFTNLQAHWYIDISFIAFKIDDWQNHKIYLEIDNQQVNIQETILDGSKNICGMINYNDQIVQVTALNLQHTSQILSILIYTDLNQLSAFHSFGIREFYVQIHYCSLINCLSCISLTECISCGNNTFLYQGQCVSQCDDSFYGDTIQNKCIACDKSCKTCYGGTSSNCLSCNDGLFFQQTLNQCLNKCNVDQYGDLQTNICKPCHKNCKTCFGGQQNNCQSCYQSTFLQQSTGECVNVCNSNQYGDTSSGICTLCHKLCKTCSGGSNDNCLSCNNGTFYQQSLNQCLTQCNSNQYKDTINNTCSSCNQTCLTCFGPDPSQCSSCQLPLYFDKITNQCKSQCSNGFYPGLINNQPVCLTCQSAYGEGCIICDQNSCFQCKSPFFAYELQCVDICPQNTITSFIYRNCSLRCDQPLVLQDSICQGTCKDGYYGSPAKIIQNNMISKCEQCDSKCQKCQNSANDCTICSDIKSTDCMSETRKAQYFKLKLCDSLGFVQQQKDCQDLTSSIDDKYIIENVVSFISLIFMVILVFTDLKFVGFLSIYYIQVVQMIGNYCLINIDSLYMTKELALKYVLTHNYFNLIPTKQIFPKNEIMKTLFSSQYYPMLFTLCISKGVLNHQQIMVKLDKYPKCQKNIQLLD